jgi:hypothetical protein
MAILTRFLRPFFNRAWQPCQCQGPNHIKLYVFSPRLRLLGLRQYKPGLAVHQ